MVEAYAIVMVLGAWIRCVSDGSSMDADPPSNVI